MNDSERRLWVENDEGLYLMWRASRMPQRAFVRACRAGIDEVIRLVTDGTEPAHYLVYGG